MGSASRLCLTNLSGPTHRLPLSVRFRERDCRYTRAIFITIFCEYCFSSIIDASIDLVRCFPFSHENKKKLNLCVDLVNLKVLFLRNWRELGFLCLCYRSIFTYNVLWKMFILFAS